MQFCKHPCFAAILAAVVGFLPHPHARAGDRVALVVSNATNSTGSADSTAKELAALGFRTESRKNLGYKDLESELGRLLTSAPTNGTAVFHFSGLGQTFLSGQQQSREIILQGADKANNPGEAKKLAIPLTRFFERMEKDCGARQLVIILDLEKENPTLHETEIPAESHLAELETPEFVTLFLSPSAALKNLKDSLPKPGFTYAQSELPAGGKVAGERWINGIGMVFTWCPPGSFKMGLEGAADAKPVETTISRGFWIATYEFTQREYKCIRGRDIPRDVLRAHRNAPVTQIGNGAPDFAKQLTELERKAGRLPPGWEYRVPTEAQWEYACRAGSTTRYSFGDSGSELHLYANFADRTLRENDPAYHYADPGADDGVGESLALVGSYKPNAWGIHDMHGNVAEWCRESYLPSLPGGTDPFPVPEKDSGQRVARGGAWCSLREYCQSGFRNYYSAGNNTEKTSFLGARFVLEQDK